jgi:hypothetical protein
MYYLSSPTFTITPASYLPIYLAVDLADHCEAFCYEPTTANKLGRVDLTQANIPI